MSFVFIWYKQYPNTNTNTGERSLYADRGHKSYQSSIHWQHRRFFLHDRWYYVFRKKSRLACAVQSPYSFITIMVWGGKARQRNRKTWSISYTRQSSTGFCEGSLKTGCCCCPSTRGWSMAKIVVVPPHIYSDLWPSVDQDHETLNKSIFNGWNFDPKAQTTRYPFG